MLEKSLLHGQGYVFKHETVDMLSTSLVHCIYCWAIIEPPWLDIWDSQDVSFLAYGNESYHHTPAGSTGPWLSEGWSGNGCCGSTDVEIWLRRVGMLRSDQEQEYVLHPERRWWGSSMGLCSPSSFLFRAASSTEAIFSLLKANSESSDYLLCKSCVSVLGVQIPRNPVSFKG